LLKELSFFSFLTAYYKLLVRVASKSISVNHTIFTSVSL